MSVMVRRIWVTAAAGAVLLPAWLLASDDDTRMLWDTALARHRRYQRLAYVGITLDVLLAIALAGMIVYKVWFK